MYHITSTGFLGCPRTDFDSLLYLSCSYRLEDAQTDVSAGSLLGSTLRFGSVCVLVAGSF